MSQAILLDTNVLSELMRPAPTETVLTWFDAQQESAFYTSAVTQAEILLGIALLPGGKRRDALAYAADQMFKEDFIERCLAFDQAAAYEYALLVAKRKICGQPITTEDAQIAAIALKNQLLLATRNTKDFQNIDGLLLINPWQSVKTG